MGTAPARKKRAQATRRTVVKVLADDAKGTCFVLMPFKEPFETYYTAIIRPSVFEAGLVPIRGDSIFRSSPIMADIWQLIRDASIVVGELSERNANVFYELGLAHSIGKPVILIAESITDVPFDLQALRVILYDKNMPDWGERLSTRLIAYITETMRDTTSAIPSMFRNPVASQAPPESELAVRIAAIEQELVSIRQFYRGEGQPNREPRTNTDQSGPTAEEPMELTLASRIEDARRAAFHEAFRRGRTTVERARLLGISRVQYYEMSRRYNLPE